MAAGIGMACKVQPAIGGILRGGVQVRALGFQPCRRLFQRRQVRRIGGRAAGRRVVEALIQEAKYRPATAAAFR